MAVVRTRTLAAIIACSTSAFACSVLAPSDDELMGGAGASGTGASSGSGGSGGAVLGGGSGGAPTGGSPATGGVETGGTGGVISSGGGKGGAPTGGAGGAPTGGTGGGSCISGTFGATPQPVALYLLLDRTVSVQTNGLWTHVEGGIGNYLDGAVPAGTEMGLQYFPIQSGTCAGAGYDTPLVSIAPLPGNATAIKQSVASPPASTTSNTPIDGVLQGGIKGCQTFLGSHPNAQCNFVLISDYSTSNVCSSNINQQIMYLQNGRLGTPRVLTYVIRLAPSASLDTYAQAGGTQSAYPGTSNLTLAASLKAAHTSCQFELPQNALGGTVSWALQGTQLSQVTEAAGCSNEQQYFLTPQAMVLCPQTCQSITTLASAPVTATVTCN